MYSAENVLLGRFVLLLSYEGVGFVMFNFPNESIMIMPV